MANSLEAGQVAGLCAQLAADLYAAHTACTSHTSAGVTVTVLKRRHNVRRGIRSAAGHADQLSAIRSAASHARCSQWASMHHKREGHSCVGITVKRFGRACGVRCILWKPLSLCSVSAAMLLLCAGRNILKGFGAVPAPTNIAERHAYISAYINAM